MQVGLAPGPDGTLFVSIPRAGGSVLALLSETGEPRPGWPIVVKDSTWCDLVLPVADGSVRVVCTLENAQGNMFDPMAAFAFDPNARLLPGWPVAVEGFSVTGRVIGDDLILYTTRSLGDVIEDGQPSSDGGLLTVAADGSVEHGVRVPGAGDTGWRVGPDGVAYGIGTGEVSEIGAVGMSGALNGWPRSFDGFASAPGFGLDERIVLTVGSPTEGLSEVLAFERDGDPLGARSAAIPIVTINESWGDTGGCPPTPQPPLVASDGTTFLYSEADDAVVAVDPSLQMLRGWPFHATTPLLFRDERYVKEDAYCPSIAVPAVGPDSSLYLPLEARRSTVGGSIVAVGPDGRVRPGWPVELTRPGAEFWSVAVGLDGTVYALAIEPESKSTSSASVLAIAPDSAVLSTTTIVEP